MLEWFPLSEQRSAPDPIYIDPEGRLLTGAFPLGRNAIESTNHLANDAAKKHIWQRINNNLKME